VADKGTVGNWHHLAESVGVVTNDGNWHHLTDPVATGAIIGWWHHLAEPVATGAVIGNWHHLTDRIAVLIMDDQGGITLIHGWLVVR